jgi:hypothetical protein
VFLCVSVLREWITCSSDLCWLKILESLTEYSDDDGDNNPTHLKGISFLQLIYTFRLLAPTEGCHLSASIRVGTSRLASHSGAVSRLHGHRDFVPENTAKDRKSSEIRQLRMIMAPVIKNEIQTVRQQGYNRIALSSPASKI